MGAEDFDFDWIVDGDPGEPRNDFYAQVIIPVIDHAPLLAAPVLARRVMAALDACAPDAPGRLWAYVVLPDAVRLVAGPADDDRLDQFVEAFKAESRARLLDAILRADDNSIDTVLRYTPVWGGVIFRVWQAGYHRQVFWTEYKLSNAIYSVFQVPLEAGLVEQADDWPYTWVSSE